MGADSQQNQPLGFLASIIIMLGISKGTYINSLLSFNFVRSTMPDKQRFASPLECDILALGDVSKFYLNFGQSQHISWGTHWRYKLMHYRFGCIHCSNWPTCKKEKKKKEWFGRWRQWNHLISWKLLFQLIVDWLILMEYQPFWDYFMPRD